MSVRLTFDGAAGTVTGSRYVLAADGRRMLIDAGLFQGSRELRQLNWRRPAFEPRAVERVLLTHTHIDHAGYLPRLAAMGFRGEIVCTRATRELAGILLMDAAKLQEEDAAYANRKRYSRHEPALPLFTADDARAALRLMRGVDYDEWLNVGAGARARFLNAGHILGSASIEVRIDSGASGHAPTTIVFSGDVGRYGVPLHVDPEPLPSCDVLVVESTYGDRLHDRTPLVDALRAPVAETVARGGTVLVPSFAVARTQLLMVMLGDLMRSGDLPVVPIDIDSPMAVDVTHIYDRYAGSGQLDPDLEAHGVDRLAPANVRFHRTVEESKQLNGLRGPRIIISASGMLTGGRVLHHARRLLPEPKNLVLMVGFQAAGTPGRQLEDGAAVVRIHGDDVPVRARVVCVHSLSAHADADELLRWVRTAPQPPRVVFVTHGEPAASAALAARLGDAGTMRVVVPHLGAAYDLAQEMEQPAAVREAE
ncbi:MAG: MBL fold metallo-hydrolase [Chloroflexota bacterium]|nr:MBL fold metallo-hydrolase [Chloroflexota bacterium]